MLYLDKSAPVELWNIAFTCPTPRAVERSSEEIRPPSSSGNEHLRVEAWLAGRGKGLHWWMVGVARTAIVSNHSWCRCCSSCQLRSNDLSVFWWFGGLMFMSLCVSLTMSSKVQIKQEVHNNQRFEISNVEHLDWWMSYTAAMWGHQKSQVDR